MAYTTIDKSSLHFNTKLYTGTGSSNAITGIGFQPDWVWIKERAGAQHDHNLFDAVRGVTKSIKSNTNGAQTTDAQDLKSFDSNGFTLGTNGGINENNITFASWNWKANGQGSANTSGSINTTYTSANTTSGFSICQWTGTQSTGTIAHGLGKVPKVIFVKNTSSTDSWNVFAKTGYMNENYRLLLDTEGARISDSDAWNSQVPTSSYFTVGSNTGTNKSGSSLIAYVFAEVQGFSKFSEYTGNGNAEGPFIYTGFKPAFIIIKLTSSTESWRIYDSKRIGYNVDNKYLNANNSASETIGSTLYMDILSNGFKLRGTDNSINSDGGSYLYMAFAEAPLVGSNNQPANSR